MGETPGVVVEDLVDDLLEWIGVGPRDYLDVMDAWRTSCPRLPVWEEALQTGLVVVSLAAGRGRVVTVTSAGRDRLARRRPHPVQS